MKNTWIFIACFIFSSVAVSAELTSGTGFLVSADGFIVTNNHVVGNAEKIKVRTNYGALHDAAVVKRDTNNDLVVLKIEGKNFPYLSVSSSTNIKRGEKVYTLGFPQVNIQGSEPKLTDGVVSSLSGLRDEPTSFQITNAIQPGNSGGPLFTEDGDVIGVIVSTLDAIEVAKLTGNIPQNVNFAIKSNYIIELLRSTKSFEVNATKKNKGIFSKTPKLVDIVRQMEQSVVLITTEGISERGIASSKKSQPPRAQSSSSDVPGANSSSDKNSLITISECRSMLPDLRAKYPKKLDSLTSIIDVDCVTIKGRVGFVYMYQLSVPKSDIDIKILERNQGKVRKDLCSSKELRDALNALDIWYYYTDSQKEDVFAMVTTRADCN